MVTRLRFNTRSAEDYRKFLAVRRLPSYRFVGNAGIGSEGYVSLGGKSPKTNKQIRDQRRFYGCELKPEYHAQAIRNLESACRQANVGRQQDLFAEVAT